MIQVEGNKPIGSDEIRVRKIGTLLGIEADNERGGGVDYALWGEGGGIYGRISSESRRRLRERIGGNDCGDTRSQSLQKVVITWEKRTGTLVSSKATGIRTSDGG